jgi:lysylphosphatidylglycerol synthetase-like protein (DUF2156 family)
LSGKRRGKKRKRRAPADRAPVATESTATAGKPARRVAAPDQRPPAPWGNFPLAELVILGGIVALVIGIVGEGRTATALGIALAGLGGLEVAVREHLAGYRSHTTLLAGFAFVLTVGVLLYLAGQILAVALGAGAVVFAIVFLLARRAFQRASGGLSFRVGGMRG